jgi:hypothetical protein
MHRTTARLVLASATLAALAGAGCRRPSGQTISLTKDQEQQIAEHVLAAPPANLQNKLEVKFEDKISLLGYDVTGEAKKGGAFDVTMYWRVNEPVPGDWKVFVHFESPGKKRQPFDHYGVGGLYPVQSWKKGEIVKDTVHIEVPGDWPDGPTQILVGFFDWGALTKGQDRRLKVEPGKGLPDDRLLLTTLNVGGGGEAPRAGGAAQARLPAMPALYEVTRVEAPLQIDGKADEPAWQAARTTGPYKQPDGQPLNGDIAANARLLWDDAHLYVTVQVRDQDVQNKFDADDATLWEGDVAEMFVQLPGGDGKYIELQWAPNGKRFDALFTGHRQPEWQEAAKWSSAMTSAVTVDGTVGDGVGDRGWTVEAAIPWKALGLDKAPEAGTRLSANLYRIDHAGTHDPGHMGAWAPVGGDFHKLDGAGSLVLK